MRRRSAIISALGVAAVVAGAAESWTLGRRRDDRAIAADPEGARLSERIQGRPVAVESADGTVLHAEVFGPEDAPPIVLVHGWACALQLWHYQIGDLSQRFRVIAYDQRGHARSRPAASGDYSMAALAADLSAVLDQCVPPGRKAVVAGHSMGAMAVVAWAAHRPDDVDRRIGGAVLANTGVSKLVRQSEILVAGALFGRFKESVGGRIISFPMPLPSRSTPLLYRAIRFATLGSRATPAQVAFCEEMFINCAADVRAAFGASLSKLDLLEGVSALTVPTVVIVGCHDRATPPSHGKGLLAGLPDGSLVEVPDAGHMTPIEAHEAVSDAICSLADRVLR